MKLLLISDQKLFQECLTKALNEEASFTLAGDGVGFEDAFELMSTGRPDVILLDIEGAEKTAKELVSRLRAHPDLAGVKTLVLGPESSRSSILECVEVGANGHISKDVPLEELTTLIRRAIEGRAVCSPPVAYAAFVRLAELSSRLFRRRRLEALLLTPGELRVLRLIAKGLSNKEIANHLSLSEHTIKNHVHNILSRLKLRHRLDAVLYARKRRWLRD